VRQRAALRQTSGFVHLYKAHALAGIQAAARIAERLALAMALAGIDAEAFHLIARLVARRRLAPPEPSRLSPRELPPRRERHPIFYLLVVLDDPRDAQNYQQPAGEPGSHPVTFSERAFRIPRAPGLV